jgi:hypothetical protein
MELCYPASSSTKEVIKLFSDSSYLVIFQDGDHMVFANARGRRGDGSKDARFHDLIRMSTTAFWNAYLRGDTAAKNWLQGDGLQKVLTDNGTLEQKKTTNE